MRLVRPVVQSSSLQHVHVAGGEEYNVWGDRREFLTFIQSLPRMSYLGLEGGCIPLVNPNDTTSPSRARFGHPNLRRLYLKDWAWRVFRFLEFVPLQTLDSLEFQANCTGGVSDIECRNPQRVFQEFWKGRGEAPRSLAVFTSGSVLEIALGQCQTPGHDANVPLLKFAAAGFKETAQKAWERLSRVLPLGEVKEVVHNFPPNSSSVNDTLRLVPRASHVIAKVAAGAL